MSLFRGLVLALAAVSVIGCASTGGEFDKPGFVTKIEDGRLWVFAEGSEELAAFEKDGELAKHITLISRGPNGMTLKAPDKDTALAYLGEPKGGKYDRPGFITKIEDGRLWVFAEGSEELAAFEKNGELAKHITLIARGPDGMTLKAPDKETALAYLGEK